jgi:hypothetical protein
MRIAVVGAYGSGKTTLTAQLAAATGLPVSSATPMASPLGSTNVAASACTPAELVQLTVRRLVERSVEEARHAHGFVSDGSVLHDWIYAESLLRYGSYPDRVPASAAVELPASASGFEPLDVVRQVALLARHDVAARYDLWLHVPVTHPLTDPVPPISEEFRRITDERLLAVLAAAGVHPHELTGDPTARLAHATRLVELALVAQSTHTGGHAPVAEAPGPVVARRPQTVSP